jgi:Rod binding domain-containing protein
MRRSVVEEALEKSFDPSELSGPQRSEVARLVSDVLRLVENNADQLLAQQRKIEKVAKDFEGIFVRQIMDVMRKTLDESGLGEDATGKQVRDMYWMFLGDQVAQTGSLGMWKQIAADIARSQQGMSGSTLETLE